jgi:lysophospholipase L1-like esterase
MLECLILGDSIAVGIAQQRHECVVIAKGGINSWQFNNKNITNLKSAKTAIISLGSNDHKGVRTKRELETLREMVDAEMVFWILPHGNLKASGVDIEQIQIFIRELAADYGDVVLPITNISSDKVHPSAKGYKLLANQTR